MISRDVVRPPVPEPLPSPVADTHCHLDIADVDGLFDAQAAVAAAASVGVTRVVQIGCDLPSAAWSVGLAARLDAVVAGVSLHPNDAPALAARGELDAALAEIERLAASSPRVRAVGETGLDYFRTGVEGRTAQEDSFRAHIDIAKRLDRTLVIHDRDSHDDVLRVLEQEGAPERVVFHCFSGDAAMAAHCVERGWFLSFAGTVTFRNAESLRDAMRVTPLAQLLTETDAPYLTPHPYRGQVNASYLVPITVRRMASELHRDLDELCRALWDNSFRAFGGPW